METPHIKTVLNVGHCHYDFPRMRRIIEENFNSEVIGADTIDDALQIIEKRKVDLLLINRVFAFTNEDGFVLLQKAKEKFPHIPAILITNYPDMQKKAMKCGSEECFGKRDLDDPQIQKTKMFQVLQRFLQPKYISIR